MLVIESQRRCPRDGKRLVADMGQNDTAGDLEALLECLHCGYREMQRPERDRTAHDGTPLLAQIRDKIRDPDKPVPPPAAFEPYIEEVTR